MSFATRSNFPFGEPASRLLSSVYHTRSVRWPERFRGGCSFGAPTLAASVALPAGCCGKSHHSALRYGRPMSQPIATSVKSLTEPVGFLGGHWMLHPEVLKPCRDAGYPHGYAYYVAGRGGVLGDVDSDVVAASFGFFEPSLVRKMWDTGVAVEGAAAAASRYGQACAQFGRVRLAGFAEAARVSALAGKVADGVDITALPLFAGWRAQPRPDDAEGRAAFLMHVLRELRGGVHLLAVVATGLGPRAAVFASGGATIADQFGWAGPYDELAGTSKQPAEALTDEILIRLYSAVLSSDEAADLAGLVAALRKHFDGYNAADG